MSNDTIFHKIIRREIPAAIVYEDDEVLGFKDIAPQAPIHILFVPKVTVPTLNDVQPDQAEVIGRKLLAQFAAPFDLGDERMARVGATIGFALGQRPVRSPAELVRVRVLREFGVGLELEVQVLGG